MTLEHLHELMTQYSAGFPGQFKLKKGLLGKSIMFDVYMQVQPRITIKDNVVTCRKMSNSTTVSTGIGGASVGTDIKASKQYREAMKEGGLKKAISGGPEYFHGVCDALRDMLKAKM
jgi:hypothetical protein